jgi:hypothetical protein
MTQSAGHDRRVYKGRYEVKETSCGKAYKPVHNLCFLTLPDAEHCVLLLRGVEAT